jgi:hypothetical protein
MNIDKNYFLSRLQAGESMDDIGVEMAAMMNEAVAAHNAELEAQALAAAKADQEAAKRDLIEEMIEIVQELAILEGVDPADIEVTEDTVDQMVTAFTEMFGLMKFLKQMANDGVAVKAKVKPDNKITPVVNAPKSDDEVLANFIKNLM